MNPRATQQTYVEPRPRMQFAVDLPPFPSEAELLLTSVVVTTAAGLVYTRRAERARAVLVLAAVGGLALLLLVTNLYGRLHW